MTSPARTVAAAIVGNALEFYDFTVYAVFATFLARAFFPPQNLATSLLLSIATFGVGFIARPFGGMLIGAYADRYGRKPAMTLTIWLMALGSGAIGLLPGYTTIGMAAPALLVVARLLQGFSAGGEMGPTTALLLESAPRHRLGAFGSWQMASQHMGQVISGVLGLGLATMLPASDMAGWGWRIPFLFGVAIAPVGIWLRRSAGETFDQAAAPASMRLVLAATLKHWRTVLCCILAISGLTVTQYFFMYATVFAINTLGFAPRAALAINVIVGTVGVMFSLVGGLLADRWGLRALAVLPRVATTILLFPAMWLLVRYPSPWLFSVVLAGLMALHAMAAAAAIIVIPLGFPAPIRTAGLSVSYALGVTLFGGTAQIVFTWLIQITGNALIWIVYVTVLSAVSVLATKQLARCLKG